MKIRLTTKQISEAFDIPSGFVAIVLYPLRNPRRKKDYGYDMTEAIPLLLSAFEQKYNYLMSQVMECQDVLHKIKGYYANLEAKTHE